MCSGKVGVGVPPVVNRGVEDQCCCEMYVDDMCWMQKCVKWGKKVDMLLLATFSASSDYILACWGIPNRTWFQIFLSGSWRAS